MNEEMNMNYMRELVTKYKEEVSPLLPYLHWLEQQAGNDNSTQYDGGEAAATTMSFPIFDGTLLNFVKEANKTSLMEKNYLYVYSRNSIKTPKDEKAVIEKATIQDWNILCGILTRYVRGGMTQSY